MVSYTYIDTCVRAWTVAFLPHNKAKNVSCEITRRETDTKRQEEREEGEEEEEEERRKKLENEIPRKRIRGGEPKTLSSFILVSK